MPSENNHRPPLSEPTLLILLSMWSGPSYGYAVSKQVVMLSGGRVRLSTGTLYESLQRAREAGWIQAVQDAEPVSTGRVRHFYALTESGRQEVRAEAARIRNLCECLQTAGVGPAS